MGEFGDPQFLLRPLFYTYDLFIRPKPLAKTIVTVLHYGYFSVCGHDRIRLTLVDT